MSEEKDEKRINLLPLCAAFNLLQLDVSGTVAVNVAAISYLKVRDNGSLEVGMQGGKQFVIPPDQAEELVNATRRALEQAHRQAERASNRSLLTLPGMAH